MTIAKAELDALLAKLGEALTDESRQDEAEMLRLSLWKWLDDRDAAINPPTDRRSEALRKLAERQNLS